MQDIYETSGELMGKLGQGLHGREKTRKPFVECFLRVPGKMAKPAPMPYIITEVANRVTQIEMACLKSAVVVGMTKNLMSTFHAAVIIPARQRQGHIKVIKLHPYAYVQE